MTDAPIFEHAVVTPPSPVWRKNALKAEPAGGVARLSRMNQRTKLGFSDDDWRQIRKLLTVAGALVAVGIIPNKYGKMIAAATAVAALMQP
jgi:hypothetical protein